MKKQIALLVSLFALTLFIGGWLTLPPGNADNVLSNPVQQDSERYSAVSPVAEAPETELPSEDLPSLPDELAETLSFVTLVVDSDGNLVPTPDLRQLFDMYLSALDEHPQEQVLGWLEQALSTQLAGHERALEQARDLLDRYIQYRLAAGELAENSQPSLTHEGFNLEVLRYRQQQLLALRSNHFEPAEAEAFFKLEEVQDRYTLEYLSVSHNENLSHEAKQQALAALDQTLPEEIRELRQRTTRHADVYEQVKSLREEGASAAEVYQARAQALGDDAAANLAELDKQRAGWKRRLQEFSEQKAQILNRGLPENAEARAIAQIIERDFSGTERLRVQALAPEL
ncbi:lipase secretion chaperone [Marinobacter sp. chi1]|uniref:Lipase chaperone n=1 Tax=Marinobacter suaedae TaxID=3057675 RepID=A0ABT8VVY9_9GAMM|nr:lipase secretion chaperone [Marinobacter sp. chi1]MDO3720153.1 lipase secretion chaperone [Marinobacter sp. chi1]